MFSREQLDAIEYISQGGKTNKQIAELVGVSETTIYNWKNNKEFCDSVLVRSQELFRHSQPDVVNTLIRKAKSGDAACLRIYFDHLEVVEKMRNTQQDLNVSFSWAIPEVSGCITS